MKKKSLKRCLKKRMILLLGFLMMTGVAVAQQLQVQGKVTDATGEGLIGASVLVQVTRRLLYTSDVADERTREDSSPTRIINRKH